MRSTFAPGTIVITPGAIRAFRATEANPVAYLRRHLSGDWGELEAADKRGNERSLRTGVRLLSAYRLPNGARIWIITEADRSQTTILLPQEY